MGFSPGPQINIPAWVLCTSWYADCEFGAACCCAVARRILLTSGCKGCKGRGGRGEAGKGRRGQEERGRERGGGGGGGRRRIEEQSEEMGVGFRRVRGRTGLGGLRGWHGELDVVKVQVDLLPDRVVCESAHNPR